MGRMNPILKRILIGVFIAAACAAAPAQAADDYAKVSVTYPGKSGHTLGKSEFVSLVVDGPTICYEGSAIPTDEVVSLVNGLLRDKKATLIGVFVRAGSKYGDVMRAVDLLRKTNACNIGVSSMEISGNREP